MNREPTIFNVWTDGSYNRKTKEYAGAYFIEELDREGVNVQNDGFSNSQNIAGECLAVINALDYISANFGQHCKVIVHHDYTGLAAWAYGEWQSKAPIAKWYVSSLYRFRDMSILFHKVTAHSGVNLNVRVDRLAAKALNVEGRE